ncbi:universal stress protein [Streptomyces chartreusis]
MRQAELTGAAAEAVTAWDIPQFRGSLAWLPPSSSDEGAVEVGTVVRYGTPASVLLTAAREASLLVVGSRGRGGFAGLLLGSVAQYCFQHAACPVVVFREGTE